MANRIVHCFYGATTEHPAPIGTNVPQITSGEQNTTSGIEFSKLFFPRTTADKQDADVDLFVGTMDADPLISDEPRITQ